MSTGSDWLYEDILNNPPASRVTLWLRGGHVLRGSMHVPAMPAAKADPFPLTILPEDNLVMVDPEAIVAYTRY